MRSPSDAEDVSSSVALTSPSVSLSSTAAGGGGDEDNEEALTPRRRRLSSLNNFSFGRSKKLLAAQLGWATTRSNLDASSPATRSGSIAMTTLNGPRMDAAIPSAAMELAGGGGGRSAAAWDLIKVWSCRCAIPPIVLVYVVLRPIFEVVVIAKRWDAPCSLQLKIALLVSGSLSLLLMLIVVVLELVLLFCWTTEEVDREMSIRSEIRTKAKELAIVVGCFIVTFMGAFIASYTWLSISYATRGDCDGLLSSTAAFEVFSLPAMVGAVFAALLLQRCAENRVWLRCFQSIVGGSSGGGSTRRGGGGDNAQSHWSIATGSGHSASARSAMQYSNISGTMDAADELVEV